MEFFHLQSSANVFHSLLPFNEKLPVYERCITDLRHFPRDVWQVSAPLRDTSTKKFHANLLSFWIVIFYALVKLLLNVHVIVGRIVRKIEFKTFSSECEKFFEKKLEMIFIQISLCVLL